MRPFVIVLIGFILALWLSAGRWVFGLGGWLTLWYLPTLGLVYFLVHLWVARRVSRTKLLGRTTSRGTKVSLIISWSTAVLAGLMIPDMHEGSLTSIASHYTGSDTALEMAIALSNTLGIVSLTLLGSAVGFAINDSRETPSYVEE
ncbi:MAG TPA: hypothetical protein VLZ31_01535 [Microbacteriaceae bacterium]|nr:hypothetical protein [Microbacteriaceae bacterium]